MRIDTHQKWVFFGLISLLMASCGVIRRAEMAVDPNLSQAATRYPVQVSSVVRTRQYRFANYLAEKSNWSNGGGVAWAAMKIKSRTLTRQVAVSLQTTDGKSWAGRCGSESSVTSAFDVVRISSKNKFICDYVEKSNESIDVSLEIIGEPVDPVLFVGDVFNGKIRKGDVVLYELQGIHRDAKGSMFLKEPLGFNILKNGQVVGAIQSESTGEPTVWMPLNASIQEQTAIALIAPALLSFNPPSKN